MSCPRLISICYLTFLLSMADHAFAKPSTVEMPRSYCGISSMYGAVSSIYKAAGKPLPCNFADLISEKFVSSSEGSTNADLESVASFCHLKAETISGRGWNTLANATGPLVLHTYPRGAPGKYSHWLLFLGIEDSNAIVIDGEGGKTLLTKSDLLSRWDGIAIVVYSLDFPRVNSISVEIVPILGAISLVGGLILLVSNVVQIRRVGNSVYGNLVAFWMVVVGNAAFRVIIGVTLLHSGIVHLQNLPGFYLTILNYKLTSQFFSVTASSVLPVLHVAVGLCLLLNEFVFSAALTSLALFSIYFIAQVAVVSYGIEADCGCFGRTGVEQIGWYTICRIATLGGLSFLVTMFSFWSLSGNLLNRSENDFSSKGSSKGLIGRRSGLTLIELAVSISIVGLLFALLLPAISSIRESSRKVTCGNRSRQLVLAAIHHELSQKYYPSNGWGVNWVGMNDQGFGARQPGGWLYSVLPFLEQGVLHKLAPSEFSLGQTISFEAYSVIEVSVLLCPSRPFPNTIDVDSAIAYHYANPISFASRTDFAVNSGDAFYVNGFGPASLRDRTYSWPSMKKATGLAHVRSEILSSQITDGKSNVIYCGEKWAISPYESNKDPGNNQPWHCGDAHDIRRFTFSPPCKDGSKNCNMLSFGSAHSFGCNFAFVDGSVHFILFSIHPDIFKSLGNRSDGGLAEVD